MKKRIINYLKTIFNKKNIVYICKIILKAIWFHILTLILLPFAIPFIGLSLISYKFFWDKIWCDIIMDKIDKLGLIPMFYGDKI